MKVSKLYLENFKKFQSKELDFTDVTGEAKDMIILVGKNGSGKSTILQAIAAMLSAATRPGRTPAELEWPGFDLSLSGTSWPNPPKVEIDVAFSEDELQATREFFDKSPLAENPEAIPPGNASIVRLSLDPTDLRIKAANRSEYFQFRGREYARMIFRYSPNSGEIFKRVGSVFWYTEQRTTNSVIPLENTNGHDTGSDLNALRRTLNSFLDFHEKVRSNQWVLKPGQRDIYTDLVGAYQTVFPNRSFYGSVPHFDIGGAIAEPWFYFHDGTNTYELSEMSGAERAIFPMIFDFANWSINNSVILIDEIELHLHPPLQRTLIKALPRLGQNNQFIMTTHSEAVASVAPSDAIVYL